MLSVLLPFLVAAAAPAHGCTYDRNQVLSLDLIAFDQGPNGWRRFEQNPQCQPAAADMIRDYRQVHHSSSVLLFWHEGQLRADAGQRAEAIALFKRSYQPHDRLGWNFYVDGTIAFLEHNRIALQAARNKLAALPMPADLSDADRKALKADWPQNLWALDAFLTCFRGTYYQAYGEKCPSQLRERGATSSH